MKRFNLMAVLIYCMGIIWSALGATIFSDNFSDSNQTKIKWVTQPANLSMKFSAGALTLKNPDTVYTGFLIHNFAVKPARFTLSLKFTVTSPEVNGAGLICCLNSAGNMTRYEVLFGTAQNIYVYKYTPTPTQLISNKSNSFINQTTNVLAVSKSADTFNIFCNGHYVTHFSDNQFSNGDIAVVVPPASTFDIGDAVMTDQFMPAAATTCFQDSFKSAGLEGWNRGFMMDPPPAIGAGGLVFADSNNTYSSIIYTDGDYRNASMKACVRQHSGAGMYGITYVSVINGDSGRISYKSYAFLVDSLRRYAIAYPDSANIWIRPAQSFIYGALGTDTLEVLRYATHFAFRINGYDVGEIIPVPATYNIDGAGLYVSRQTAAVYSYFVAGGDSTGARCHGASPVSNHVVRAGNSKPVFESGSIIYDIMGRKIGGLDRISIARGNIVDGLYFIWSQDAKTGAGRISRYLKVTK